MKRYYIYDWQSKSLAFDQVMSKNGFVKTDDVMSADIVLVDVDLPSRVEKLKPRIRAGRMHLFCYPHAAIPSLFWDGIIAPSEFVSASFVVADGHKQVLDAYGYPNPTFSVGWSYSDILPFKPCEIPKKILFAPVHPNESTFLPKEDKDLNCETFWKLLPYCRNNGIELTVRHIETLEKNGLWKAPNVIYSSGQKKVGKQIQKTLLDFDLVVSKQTLAWTSVALGIPTIFMGEDICPKSGKDEEHIRKVLSWEKYKHLMMFPLDISKESISTLVPKASLRETDDVVKWKSLMIGNPFDEKAFVDVIKKFIQ